MHYLIDLLNMAIKTDVNMEEAILAAAEKLFLEKGFASTSTTEIAKEAGCNQALVHYYYRKKDLLFTAIFEKKMKGFVSELLAISEEDLPFEEKLTRKIESHFEMIQSNPRIPFLLFSELNSNPDRMESLREMIATVPRPAIQKFQEELDEEIAKGTIRSIKVHDLLMTMVSLNTIPFLAKPMIAAITGSDERMFNQLVEARKKENVQVILKSLKP